MRVRMFVSPMGLSVALVVTAVDAIDAVQRGDAQEVGAGYRVDYRPHSGVTPDGESYDGIQRNIKVNHIALVPVPVLDAKPAYFSIPVIAMMRWQRSNPRRIRPLNPWHESLWTGWKLKFLQILQQP